MGLGGRTRQMGGGSDRGGLEEIMTSDRILLLFFFSSAELERSNKELASGGTDCQRMIAG